MDIFGLKARRELARTRRELAESRRLNALAEERIAELTKALRQGRAQERRLLQRLDEAKGRP